MKITQLDLNGYRAFKNESVDFDRSHTVFVGKNGAGKTSILDAIFTMLSQYSARLVGSSGSARRLKDTDIRIGEGEAELRIVVSDDGGDRVEWSLRKQGARERVYRHAGSDLSALNDLVKRIAAGSSGNEYLQGETLPIYYDQLRTVLKIPQRRRAKYDDTALAVFQNSIVSSGINFPQLTYWFFDRETAELRKQRRTKTYFDRDLEAVRKIIAAATNLQEPFYNTDAPRGLTLSKNDVAYHVSQLSSGERVLMALVADLARKLSAVAPRDTDPLSASAIVLIDEIELHMHPRWQQALLPILIENFPNCQFIVSTHSPHVITTIGAKHVRVLDEEGGRTIVRNATATHGRDINYLLSGVFEAQVRDASVEKKLEEAETAISNREIVKADVIIDELEREMEGGAPELSILRARLTRRRAG